MIVCEMCYRFRPGDELVPVVDEDGNLTFMCDGCEIFWSGAYDDDDEGDRE